jgi:hypothetical protein
MSIKLGPNIHNENLIFAIDPKSEKSWDGTNLLNLVGDHDTTTATGTISFDTDGGGTFTFDANSSYFSYGTTNSLYNLYDVTLVGWVKQPSTSSPHQTVICTSSSYLYGLKLMSRYHGEVAAWIGDGGSNSHLLGSGVNIEGDGSYHMIACTRNGGNGHLKIYIDGVEYNNVEVYPGGIQDGGNTYVGADYHSAGYRHTGNIGQVYAFNSLLSTDDLIQMYNAGKERYGL